MDLTALLSAGAGISDLLLQAGMDPAHVKRNRAFWGNWGWTDGTGVFTTIWLDEVKDPSGVPKWAMSAPQQRDELTGLRRKRAQDLWDMLVSRNGQPVRVILQTKKADQSKWRTGITERRGLDPEPWFVAIEQGAVLLQRGSRPGPSGVSVDGKPMQERKPSWSERETGPSKRPSASGWPARPEADVL